MLGQGNDGALQAADFTEDAVDGGTGIEADIGRNLVVARAAGVQTFTGVADEIRQAFFDVHVHVFQRRVPDELATRDFIGNAVQSAGNGITIGGAEDALLNQHRGVCFGAGDVFGGKTLVKADGGSESGDEGVGRFLEASAPGAVGFRFVHTVNSRVVSFRAL